MTVQGRDGGSTWKATRPPQKSGRWLLYRYVLVPDIISFLRHMRIFTRNSSNSITSNSSTGELDSDVPDTMLDRFDLLDDIEDEPKETSQCQNDNPSSNVPSQWIRWTAGSKPLPNAQLTFSCREDSPDPEGAVVIDWDPGRKMLV